MEIRRVGVVDRCNEESFWWKVGGVDSLSRLSILSLFEGVVDVGESVTMSIVGSEEVRVAKKVSIVLHVVVSIFLARWIAK